MENVKWVLKVHGYDIMKSVLVKKMVTYSCDSKWVEKTFIWFNKTYIVIPNNACIEKEVGNGFQLNIIMSKTTQIFKEKKCLTLAKLGIQL
jgi:hypothetical protein